MSAADGGSGSAQNGAAPPRRWGRRVAGTVAAVGAGYLLLAYLILPTFWRVEVALHPALEDAPHLTRTKTGVPADPVNIAFIASEEELHRAMEDADWLPADPITLQSSLRIGLAVLEHRAYENAPVSDLYLWDRKEDFAFEQPVGDDPSRRHHVRFWRSPRSDDQGRPLWLGAATFDSRVGLSHLTGSITHHIAAEVDAERDKIIADVEHLMEKLHWIDAYHPQHEGKNGGGDPWVTDGRLAIGVLKDLDGEPAPAR